MIAALIVRAISSAPVDVANIGKHSILGRPGTTRTLLLALVDVKAADEQFKFYR